MRRIFTAMMLMSVLTAVEAQASPILLGQWTAVGSSSGNAATLKDYRNVTSVGYLLGYTITGNIPDLLDDCIGCNFKIPLADVIPGAQFDFTALNSPDFAAVVSRLTDIHPDSLFGFISLYGSDPNATEGGGGSGTGDDIVFFPTSPTWNVDFVRVIVNSFSLGPGSPCPTCPGLGYSLSASTTWEIWGTGTPSPIAPSFPAPEVPSAALMLVGLVALVGMRIRI